MCAGGLPLALSGSIRGNNMSESILKRHWKKFAAGVTAASLGAGGVEMFQSHERTTTMQTRREQERKSAEQKITELHERIKHIEGGGPATPERDDSQAQDAVTARDKKIRALFEQKYPDYILELGSVENGAAKYTLTLVDNNNAEHSLQAFQVEEDGSFTMQIPAYVDKMGRIGVQTRTFSSDADIEKLLDNNMSLLDYARTHRPRVSNENEEMPVDPKIIEMAKQKGFELQLIDDVDDLEE